MFFGSEWTFCRRMSYLVQTWNTHRGCKEELSQCQAAQCLSWPRLEACTRKRISYVTEQLGYSAYSADKLFIARLSQRRRWCVDLHSGVQSAHYTLSNTPVLGAIRHHKVPFNSWSSLILEPRLSREILSRGFLCSMSDVWLQEACSCRGDGFGLLGSLTPLAMGT